MNTPLLISLLKLHEGLRLIPYNDIVGKLTIGYGHNLDDKPISKRAAEVMLEDDIQDAIEECERLPYWDALSDVRKCVIADMVFNMGMSRFNGFIRMNRALKIGNYTKAAYEMLDSKWAGQVGERAERLSIMMESDTIPVI